MHESSSAHFTKLLELELSKEKNDETPQIFTNSPEQKIIKSADPIKHSIKALKKHYCSNEEDEALAIAKEIKESYGQFYKKRSAGPMISCVAWFDEKKNKKISKRRLYNEIREFSFSNTQSTDVMKQNTEIFCMVLTPDEEKIITGCEDNKIYIWNIKKKAIEKELEGHSSKVISLAVFNKEPYLLSGSYDKSIIMWDLRTGHQIHEFQGHDEGVHCLCISFNEETFISGGEDKQIIQWDLKTRTKMAVFKGHSSCVSNLIFLKTGKKFLSASWDTSIRLWNVEAGMQESLVGEHDEMIRTLAISPDESLLASAGADKEIRLWDLKENKQIASFIGHVNIVRSIVISYDCKYLISGGWDKAVRVWDIKKQKLIKKMKGHTNTIRCVALTMNSLIISAGWDQTIRFWKLSDTDGSCFKPSSGKKPGFLCISPEGKRVFAAVSSDIIVWDFDTTEQLALLQQHKDEVLSLEIDKKGITMFSGGAGGEVVVWNIEKYTVITVLHNHESKINILKCTPDDRFLLSGGLDNYINVWDTLTYEKVKTLEQGVGPLTCMNFSKDSNEILTGNQEGIVFLWEFIPFNLVFSLEAHEKAITGVKITTNKQKFVSSSLDCTIKIWKISSKKVLYHLKAHEDAVLSIELNEEGTKLISGSVDGTIRLWDVRLGVQIGIIEIVKNSFHSLLLNHDGTKLIASLEDCVKVWEVNQLHMLKQLENDKPIYSIIISPNEQYVITGGEDCLLRVWNFKTMEQISCFEGHSKAILALKYMKNTDNVVSGSADNTIRIWDLASKKAIKIIKGCSNSVSSLELFSNENYLIAGCYDQAIRIWNLKTYSMNLNVKLQTGPVLCVAVDPNGKVFASGSRDKTIALYDIVHKKELWNIQAHLDSVNCLLIYENSERIISGGADKTLKIWETSTGSLLKTLKSHHSSVISLLLSQKENRLVSGAYDGSIHMWDLINGKNCTNFDGHMASVNGLAVTQDENRLFSVGTDHTIRIWRLGAVETLPFLEGHTKAIIQINLVLKQEKLISISRDNLLILWDIEDCKPFRKYLYNSGEITSMAVLKQDSQIVVATTEEIIQWDLLRWTAISSFNSEDAVEVIIVSNDDTQCFAGCKDSYIRIWDLKSREKLRTLEHHLGAVTALALFHNDEKLVSGSSDNAIVIWELQYGTVIQTLTEHHGLISCILLDSKEKAMYSASYDQKVMIWDLENLQTPPKVIENLPFEAKCLALMQNEELLVVGCAKIADNYSTKPLHYNEKADFIHIYNAKTLEKNASFQKYNNCNTLTGSRNQTTLITGNSDRSLGFWDLETLVNEKTFPGYSLKIQAELMNFDASLLFLACNDRKIIVWSLKFSRLHALLEGHTGKPLCLAVTNDSSKLVSGGEDRTLRVWTLEKEENSKEIFLLQGHSSAICAISFTRDEKILMSGSVDKSIRLWNFATGKIITVLDGHLTAVKSIVDLSFGTKILSGESNGKMIIWKKMSEKIYEIEKYIVLESSVERFVMSPDYKFLLVLTGNSKIQVWNVAKWSLMTELQGVPNNHRTIPIFLSRKTNRFIIYFNKILDCRTGETVFEFQINHEIDSFFFDIKTCNYYFLSEKQKGLQKLEKSWLYSYFANYVNYDSLGILPQDPNVICNQRLGTFPFLLSFLHLISIFERSHDFDNEKIEQKYKEIRLQQFYSEDIFGNTPLDILLAKKSTALLMKYFDLIFETFNDESCTFYEKIRFLNYNFSKKKTFLDVLNELIPLIGSDLNIVSKVLELCFMKFDTKIYNDEIVFEEFEEPVFIESDEIYTINKDVLLDKLKTKLKTREKTIFDKVSRVKAKILCIPNIIDITNKKAAKIFEHFTNCDPDNDIFSNDVLEIIIQHIWTTQIRFYYIVEFVTFFIMFLLYNVGHTFLLPIYFDPGTETQAGTSDFMYAKDALLIIYSCFCLSNEIKQMSSSGFFTYFKNIWNYFDIALIPLMITTSVLNIIVISSEVPEEEGYIKMINAICMFCFWFRLLSFLRAIKETSSMMRLIFNVITSVKYFVLFMVFFMLTLASSFFMLNENFESNIFEAFFAFYKSTVGDSSGITDYEIEYPILTNIYMIASTFLFAIILLNLLVAIIGDKHSEINDAEEKTRLFELTNIVVDTNSNLVTKLVRWIRKPRKRNNYLICLYNEIRENEKEVDLLETKMNQYFKMFRKENEKILKDNKEIIEKFIDERLAKLERNIREQE